MPRNRVRPSLEPLEGRITPSVGALTGFAGYALGSGNPPDPNAAAGQRLWHPADAKEDVRPNGPAPARTRFPGRCYVRVTVLAEGTAAARRGRALDRILGKS